MLRGCAGRQIALQSYAAVVRFISVISQNHPYGGIGKLQDKALIDTMADPHSVLLSFMQRNNIEGTLLFAMLSGMLHFMVCAHSPLQEVKHIASILKPLTVTTLVFTKYVYALLWYLLMMF